MIANSQSPGNHQFFKIAVQQKYNIKMNLVRRKKIGNFHPPFPTGLRNGTKKHKQLNPNQPTT